MEDWAEFGPVLKDTEPEPGSVLQESLLVTFIRKQTTKKHMEAASYVAKLLGASFEGMFPEFAVTPEAPKKKREKANKLTSLEEIPKFCEDCEDESAFIQLTSADLWYFGEDRKYSEAKCLKCQKYYETDKNKSLGRKAELPLPTGHNAVYACPGMKSDKCCCGNFICLNCHGSRRRRRTTPATAGEAHLYI